MPRQRADDAIDQGYRRRLRDLILLRKAELEAQGSGLTYEQIAEAMEEFGKEAVLRIVKQERPITLSVVQRLAAALQMDLFAVLEELTGAARTSTRTESAVAGYLGLVSAFGSKAAGDPLAIRAARAVAGIEDQKKKVAVVEIVEAVERDQACAASGT